ncbi:TagF domain-containing protein [Sapientia aquatica]|uniref:DUF2094 domain-containing protein n=1 Tax=Sapientia aquatica TaxID=1549640 RepID=A0A4R5VRW1_9BURK|nr:TagF domain-containing protein [Sapientia aquatica]TDK61297.1 DUF2094 domain-containing protein [Sapientia aquatica]
MTFLTPKFRQNFFVSSPALWGKLPSQNEFICHNLPEYQQEELHNWIILQRRPTKRMTANRAIQVSKKSNSTNLLWHHLNPPSDASNRSSQPEIGRDMVPWCFVLPPSSLAFAPSEYVIGVWIASYDKQNNPYPLVMIQTASLSWIEQYFSRHAELPRDWLFSASRILAKIVYTDKEQVLNPNNCINRTDSLARLVVQIDELWSLSKPNWRNLFGLSYGAIDSNLAQKIIGEHHEEDPAHHLQGVRYLPWSDWPKRLTATDNNARPEPAFWQQDLNGRFIAAASKLMGSN